MLPLMGLWQSYSAQYLLIKFANFLAIHLSGTDLRTFLATRTDAVSTVRSFWQRHTLHYSYRFCTDHNISLHLVTIRFFKHFLNSLQKFFNICQIFLKFSQTFYNLSENFLQYSIFTSMFSQNNLNLTL